jgi:hypothetical protein
MKADAMAKAKGAYRKQFKDKPSKSNVRNLTDTTGTRSSPLE